MKTRILAGLVLFSGAALAQPYPSRPITFIGRDSDLAGVVGGGLSAVTPAPAAQSVG